MLSAIIPKDRAGVANMALEGQGFGPGNFSVPLVDMSGKRFLGLSYAADDDAFTDLVRGLEGAETAAALFWTWAAARGLTVAEDDDGIDT